MDEEKLKKSLDTIVVVSELMMNESTESIVEFSPGVLNKLGLMLNEAAENIKNVIKLN